MACSRTTHSKTKLCERSRLHHTLRSSSFTCNASSTTTNNDHEQEVTTCAVRAHTAGATLRACGG
eukprot:95504-Chlamydomonas_euryale.AAC.5